MNGKTEETGPFFMHTRTAWGGRTARFLSACALALFLLIMAGLACSALGMTAKASIAMNYLNLSLDLVRDHVVPNLLLTAALLLVLAGLVCLTARFRWLWIALCAAWTVAAIGFVLGGGFTQRGDSCMIIWAAECFASGDYLPMQSEYFQGYSYQLGICFFLELIKRLFPSANLMLLMQCLNALLSAGIIAALTGVAVMLHRREGTEAASMLLFLAFVPFFLYTTYVYGTTPMLLLCACAMLCFTGYTHTRQKRLGLAYAVFLGLAMVLKPNALVPAIALFICAILYMLETGDRRLAAFALLSCVLCAALPAAVNRMYELRSGVPLGNDIALLPRLTMGLQDGETAAGWYNAYTEQFIGSQVTVEAEKAQAMRDLMTRLEEMRCDPGMTLAFFREKCLSQWIEPGYEIVWHGSICSKEGRFNGLANLVFQEGETIRMLLDAYLNVFQQALYILILLGGVDTMRRREFRAEHAMIPVILIGGFLYHMLFEAKAQYSYPYVVMMLPLAARGLTMIGAGIRRIRKK